MKNLVFLTCPSLQILGKTIGQNSDGDISVIRISDQSLIKRNCHNSRISDDIHIKLGLVTKVEQKNKATSKMFENDVMSKHCDAIVTANFEQSESWSLDGQSIKLKFSSIVNSYVTKNVKQISEVYSTALTIHISSKGTILPKTCCFFAKKG